MNEYIGSAYERMHEPLYVAAKYKAKQNKYKA